MFPPEFFDIFGIFAFLYIMGVSLWVLKSRNIFPRWPFIVLFCIGTAGFLIDGFIVYMSYFL